MHEDEARGPKPGDETTNLRELAPLSTLLAIEESFLPIVSHAARLLTAVNDETEPEAARSMRAEGPQLDLRPATAGGSIAVIPLRGVITPRGSILSRLFGFASGLEAFVESFRAAMADDNVSAIVIDIDSPGGFVSQVTETAAIIRAARGTKPIVSVSNTMAASAAYWIAAQADEIVASPSANVGSIGVYRIHEECSELDARIGIKTTIISAGKYKVDGNPWEPLSKTAEQSFQSDVDLMYDMFTADVAAGRGTPQQAITAGYGQGRCVYATEALPLKMIDRIETLEQTLARLGGQELDEPGSDDPEDDTDDLDEDDDDTPDAHAEPDDVHADEPTETPEAAEESEAPDVPELSTASVSTSGLLYGEQNDRPSWAL